MSDISTTWTGTSGDYTLSGASLAATDDLTTAVLISLFTDRSASTDDVIPDGTDNHRGWWGDATIGSRLWLIQRAKRTQETLQLAQDYCSEALQWLVDDGVAARVEVSCEWVEQNRLSAAVTVFRNDGTTAAMSFAWAWVQQQ